MEPVTTPKQSTDIAKALPSQVSVTEALRGIASELTSMGFGHFRAPYSPDIAGAETCLAAINNAAPCMFLADKEASTRIFEALEGMLFSPHPPVVLQSSALKALGKIFAADSSFEVTDGRSAVSPLGLGMQRAHYAQVLSDEIGNSNDPAFRAEAINTLLQTGSRALEHTVTFSAHLLIDDHQKANYSHYRGSLEEIAAAYDRLNPDAKAACAIALHIAKEREDLKPVERAFAEKIIELNNITRPDPATVEAGLGYLQLRHRSNSTMNWMKAAADKLHTRLVLDSPDAEGPAAPLWRIEPKLAAA